MPAAPTWWWMASTSPSLGGNGAVRRDLPLDPDLIKDGKLAVGNHAGNAGTRPTTQ